MVKLHLAALAAVVAGAPVCSPDAAGKVPCFPLNGNVSMPQIAMGTASSSFEDCPNGAFGCVEEHARFAVETWLRIGGTHIDGANIYRTQVSIAQALKTVQRPREEIFITTKCPGAMGYNALIQCADDNLQMLGQFTDSGPGYIDLLLVHWPFVMKLECRFAHILPSPQCQGMNKYYYPGKEALQDTWRAMEELKRIGVVRSIGVSDCNTTDLENILEVATEPISVHQIEFNPKVQDHEMMEFAKKHQIQLQAWSPLGGSGGSVLGEPAVRKAALAHTVSTAQVTLRWAVQQGVAVVVGTANPEHAASDLDIFSFELSEEEMRDISALGVVSVDV